MSDSAQAQAVERARQSEVLHEILRFGNSLQALKQVPRTGWLLRGIGPGLAESVAAHSWGMSTIALLLASLLPNQVDLGRLLSICLLHDLAESILGDIPSPAARYFPANAKHDAERGVFEDLVGDLPQGVDWLDRWEEFMQADSLEGRIARDADRLDMLFQAAAYERAGSANLGEFWQGCNEGWCFDESAALVRLLVEQR
ncbi:MAG: HD domain-containing protein [Chloroflexota bacterium]|nr:HD domain-containing protein [Chloroflexota bacterium]